MAFIALVPSNYINVKQYGAVGDGVTNDTAALQAAINAACTQYNSRVFLPPGVYLVSSSLTFTGNFELAGSGLCDESVPTQGTRIKLANGSNCYVLQSNTPTNIFVNIRVTDMMIDGNASNQTAISGCVNIIGAVHCSFERVHFYSYYDRGVKFTNILNGQFGHHNKFIGCLFTHGDQAPAGGSGIAVTTTNCDENFFILCDFEYNKGYCIEDNAGLEIIRDCTFVSNSAVNIYQDMGKGNLSVTGCIFDTATAPAIYIQGGHGVIANNMFTWGSGDHIQINESYGGISIIGNNFQSHGTANLTNTFINEKPTGAGAANVLNGNSIVGNTFAINGTLNSGTPIIRNSPGSKIAQNRGFNPVGPITAPAIPASTVAYTNGFEVDCTVFVSGGTVTAIALGGTPIGLTSGSVRVPAGQTIALTYSVAPTWVWMGD